MLLSKVPRERLLHQLIQTKQSQAVWQARVRSCSDMMLDKLVEHAIQTVPFYQCWASKLKDVTNVFQYLPIVTKADIRKDSVAFCSTLFEPETLYWRATSGTSGEPLSICFDLGSLYGDIYDAYRDMAYFVRPLGKSLLAGKTAIVVVNDNPSHDPHTVINPELKSCLMHELVLGISDAEDEAIVKQLRGTNVPALSGRPRALLRLQELDEGIPRCSNTITPYSIITSGDNLHSDIRRHLESWFSCCVHNAYASQEGGILGIECEHYTGIHLFRNRALVEMISEEGELACKGSGEMVITNFTNWAMPFLRYRSGDTATLVVQDCACGYSGPTITELSGRDSVYFLFDSYRFNPSLLNPIFETLPVKQFQVVQEDLSGLLVKWIPISSNTNIDEVESLIATAFKEKLGSLEFKINAVGSIGQPGQKIQRYVCRR